MAKTSLAERGPSLPFLEMLAGGTPGQVYDLGGDEIRIGRSGDNDIVITSEAVSRHHAMVVREGNEWVIRDNKSKNGVQINGNPVKESPLQNGDVVQVGDFVFRFNSPALDSTPSEPQQLQADFGAAPKKRRPNKRVVIYTVLALVLGGLYFMSNNDKKDVPSGEEIVDKVDKLARDFKLSPAPNLDNNPPKPKSGIEDPLLKDAEVQMSKLDWTNSSLREAEQFFKKGQRDYLAKNYGRSIESFQTALSLYRGHELAEKYLRLAVFEAEQEAKKHMEMAVRYFDSLQYQRAIYHFQEVITLMAHRSNEPVVGEAERYIGLSKKRLQAAELFP